MTIDERLEAITMNLELAHRDIEDLHKLVKETAEGAKQTAEVGKQTAEAGKQTAENLADMVDRFAAAEERHDREVADIRAELRRAIVLSVREARQERSKRREIDDKITQLAAAQLVTEEKLQRLLDFSRGNGKP